MENHQKLNGILQTKEVIIDYDKEGRKMVNDYQFISTIGKGSYCKVKLAEHKRTSKHYAVKIINKKILKKKKKGYGKDSNGYMTIINMLDDALNEIEILKQINNGSQNLTKIYEIITDTEAEKIYLITEYCEKGSLMKFDEKTHRFFINRDYQTHGKVSYSEEEIKHFIREIAKGLDFIHSINIVHRDIKPDNILINKGNVCKLSDFNVASIIENEDVFTKTEGNIHFYPPELCDKIESREFAAKPVDVWAVGVCAYIITYKRLPFMPTNKNNFLELFESILKAEVKFDESITTSAEFKDFLLSVLEKDPKKRLTASGMLTHKFLSNK